MKRYVCTVATGLLLALVSTGTATAIEPIPPPPLPGQAGTQETTFGDQTAQQSNNTDVDQIQGNGNLNIAPAIALFGDAETTTVQGSGNEATANVYQSNSADQSQSSEQKQSLDQEGGTCCGGQSQTGEQSADFGDQTAEQSNTADVDQWQGNGNLNIAPAIAIFGDAETTTVQGSGNEANANVAQSNDASQSQDSTQKQWLDQGGSCCGGQSQTGEQTTYFGDQTAQQRNTADVTQKQGNGNLNIAPAIAIFGDAETTTVQGSGNEATANVGQSNSADQSQSSEQKQSLDQEGGTCRGGQSQTGAQTAHFGDQSAQQSNYADVTQIQGNGNLNIAPAIAVGKGGRESSCYSKCEKSGYGGYSFGGDAETKTVQGSGNTATANVGQSNSADQSQSSEQKQFLEQDGGDCCKPPVRCDKPDPCSPKKEYGEYKKGSYGNGYEGHPQDRCCEHGQSQTGEQTANFGDQTAQQRNTADVTQKQGNLNGSFAPAIGFGKGKGDSCYSKCGKSGYGGYSFGGDAETKTVQGSGNTATANVGQSNSADQSQTSYQRQSLVDWCKGLVHG